MISPVTTGLRYKISIASRNLNHDPEASSNPGASVCASIAPGHLGLWLFSMRVQTLMRAGACGCNVLISLKRVYLSSGFKQEAYPWALGKAQIAFKAGLEVFAPPLAVTDLTAAASSSAIVLTWADTAKTADEVLRYRVDLALYVGAIALQRETPILLALPMARAHMISKQKALTSAPGHLNGHMLCVQALESQPSWPNTPP